MWKRYYLLYLSLLLWMCWMPKDHASPHSLPSLPAAFFTSSSASSNSSFSSYGTSTSTITPDDRTWMKHAIQLAMEARGRTRPNPCVGCVILDAHGRKVGEGFHERAGQPHAEVNALRQAGSSAEGGTAYVTLEPCNHYGRTPPCTLALLR